MSVEFEARSQLFQQLSALPKPQFEQILFALKVPAEIVSGTTAPQGDRVADLLNWAQGSTGYYLDAVKAALAQLKTDSNTGIAISQTVGGPSLDGPCQNRQAAQKYIATTVENLKQQGCLDIYQDIRQGSQRFHTAARIQNFELPFGLFSMRGEAFFVFSEFNSIQMKPLRQFSEKVYQWAKTQVDANAVGQAVYNFRVPTHLCFAVALVDTLDEATKIAIRTTNPFDHKLDLLWYEVPVIYELEQSQLYFYDQPFGVWEQFKGEITWKRLRTVIKELLTPA